jgi:S-adenosylmethionine hydrolase
MTVRDGAARPIITLTTDFGLADSYVAEMKGIILGINAQATIVDVSHAVRPQRLLQAVFITQAAWLSFPTGAVHVAIVDPGVGTDRRAIALFTARGHFVGPDNGVLSAALPEEARPQSPGGPTSVAVPAGCRAFTITNPRLLREPLSATFHGRDVFAPAAAHLSLGMPAETLGEPVDALLAFPPIRARRRADDALEAEVVHIDRFGNVVTDARAEDLPEGPFTVELAGQRVPGPVRTYAEATGPAALVTSSGYLAVILPNGSAAETLGVEIGDGALLRPGR